MVTAYRLEHPLPPIPVSFNEHGEVNLSLDGNHRLTAAREAGVIQVTVTCDTRDVFKMQQLVALLP